MSIQPLNKAKAFEPGSDLWISPQPEVSDLTRELNWYSHFLISRTTQRKPQAISQPLKEILEENELGNLAKRKKIPDRLLLHTQHLLPNKLLLILPFKQDAEAWLKEAHTVWEQLDRPTVRFFLPKNIAMDAFPKIWPEKGVGQKTTVVGL